MLNAGLVIVMVAKVHAAALAPSVEHVYAAARAPSRPDGCAATTVGGTVGTTRTPALIRSESAQPGPVALQNVRLVNACVTAELRNGTSHALGYVSLPVEFTGAEGRTVASETLSVLNLARGATTRLSVPLPPGPVIGVRIGSPAVGPLPRISAREECLGYGSSSYKPRVCRQQHGHGHGRERAHGQDRPRGHNDAHRTPHRPSQGTATVANAVYGGNGGDRATPQRPSPATPHKPGGETPHKPSGGTLNRPTLAVTVVTVVTRSNRAAALGGTTLLCLIGLLIAYEIAIHSRDPRLSDLVRVARFVVPPLGAAVLVVLVHSLASAI